MATISSSLHYQVMPELSIAYQGFSNAVQQHNNIGCMVIISGEESLQAQGSSAPGATDDMLQLAEFHYSPWAARCIKLVKHGISGSQVFASPK